MPAFDDLPVFLFANPKAFEKWLEKNHEKVPAIRLRLGKKGSGIETVTYKEALDVALCFGWIDGQSKAENEATYLQRFGKRNPKSVWSKVNREHVARLEAEERMRPAGRAAVEAAKADGRWDAAYDSPSRATVPADLAAALAKNARAKAFFEQLDKTNRYAILHRIATLRTPAGRAKRIASYVAMLAKKEKLHA